VRDSGGVDIHAQFGVDARVGRPTPGGLLVEEQLGAAATARPLEDRIDEAKATRLRSLRMIDAVRSAKYVQPRPAKGLCIEDYARGNLNSTAVADAVALYTAAYAAVDAAEGRSFRSVSANGSDLALSKSIFPSAQATVLRTVSPEGKIPCAGREMPIQTSDPYARRAATERNEVNDILAVVEPDRCDPERDSLRTNTMADASEASARLHDWVTKESTLGPYMTGQLVAVIGSTKKVMEENQRMTAMHARLVRRNRRYLSSLRLFCVRRFLAQMLAWTNEVRLLALVQAPG
jgi:hypothetical protein